MVANTLVLAGRNGTVTVGGTTVGHAKGVSAGVKVDTIKDYDNDSTDPALLVAGNKSYSVSIEKMFIAKAHLAQVLAGTPVDVVITPVSGEAITINDVVLTDWKLDSKNNGAVLESISGEGASLTPPAET